MAGVADICKEAAELVAHEVNFLNYIFLQRSERMPQEVLHQDDIVRFYEMYDQLKSVYDRHTLHLNKLGMFGPRPDAKDDLCALIERGMFCWAGKAKHGEYYFVEVDNKVYPCLGLCSPDMQIGELVEGRIILQKDPLAGFDRKTCYCIHRAMQLLPK